VDDFAKLPDQDRRIHFEQSAGRLNLSAQIIEKDFWVCWCLKRLFLLDEFRGHLTFKGGTSLSKVYKAIERFSEDVDVAIERSILGFAGDKEPEKGETGKEQQRRLDRLTEACQNTIADRLLPKLRKAINTSLGHETGWSLSLDSSDPDRQSIVFQYPSAIVGYLSPYFPSSVKIEMGARSDHFPVEERSVTPYMLDAFPNVLANPSTTVRVLTATRTFWEKATILHRLYHIPEHSAIPPRMSRHYYDVFMLSQDEIWKEILGSLKLLDRVVEQTDFFFKRAWAKYDEALHGKLHLSPPDRIVKVLKQDYQDMQPMFFSEPPDFDKILSRLPELEKLINEGKR
jgi:hypothetical protein